MERTYIKDLKDHIGKEVSISGWVDIRRDHGKLIFLDLRDMTGKGQMVALPNHAEAVEMASKVRSEWVIEVRGMVNARPTKMMKEGVLNGELEIEMLEVKVLGKAQELPFELGAELNLDTYLDNLPLTLREEKAHAVFKVQAVIVHAFRNFLVSEGFTEFQAPKLIGEDAEGGADSFNVEYFGHTAHLAQSPQLYKQIMVGVFERVFSTGNVYRAEKHSTTRHLNEYTSLDLEMGFIKDHTDVMNMENRVLAHIVKELKEKCSAEFALFGATIPDVPEKIPAMKLREAQEVIKKETGEDCTKEPDLEPAHERFLCEYSKREFNSDFIFITHFPISKRPFYTHEDETDPGYAKGGDLLFRGIEITTLAQRIHDYDTLVQSMNNKGLDPEKFRFYLQAFKYGMPPHGGLGLGLERLTAKFLGLENVKQAALFPRDLNRIDNLLSE
ncbi:MAG TPA: aspartate--tRNA(Asn) ligase [Candidatus Yonathbacteria bacterium]|nr:aspartate--tRNA(Asn) ligase [Candidatus Yonathbacteria bacterium]